MKNENIGLTTIGAQNKTYYSKDDKQQYLYIKKKKTLKGTKSMMPFPKTFVKDISRTRHHIKKKKKKNDIQFKTTSF